MNILGNNHSSPTLQVRKEAQKYPPQLELGFRIVGMKVRTCLESVCLLMSSRRHSRPPLPCPAERCLLWAYDMQIFNASLNKHEEYGKDFGYGLTAAGAPGALARFFKRPIGPSDKDGVNAPVAATTHSSPNLPFFIQRLEKLLDWFETQEVGPTKEVRASAWAPKHPEAFLGSKAALTPPCVSPGDGVPCLVATVRGRWGRGAV